MAVSQALLPALLTALLADAPYCCSGDTFKWFFDITIPLDTLDCNPASEGNQACGRGR